MQDYNDQFKAKTGDFRADFFSMAGVFDNATQDMFPVIQGVLKESQAKILGLVGENDAVQLMTERNWINMAMRTWLRADMSNERLEAWTRANQLYNLKLAQDDPYTMNKQGELEGNITRSDHSVPARFTPSFDGIETGTLPKMAQGADGVLRSGLTDPIWDFVGGVMAGATVSDKDIEYYSFFQASKIILEFLKGGRILPDNASDFIVRILRRFEQKGELVVLMDAIGAHDLLEVMSDAKQLQTSKYFKENYYSRTAFNTVYNQILLWIGNPEGEKRQSSILDLYNSLDKNGQEKIRKNLKRDRKPDVKSLIGK